MSHCDFETSVNGSVSTTAAESKETPIVGDPTEEGAYSLGVEQGRILATNPESQGQADWPVSNDLFSDEFRPETCIGRVAAPPAIYADDGLMNAYCSGALRGFNDHHASLTWEAEMDAADTAIEAKREAENAAREGMWNTEGGE